MPEQKQRECYCLYVPPLTVSDEIKILAEVEKIWIIYDLNNDQRIDYEEIRNYIVNMADPYLKLTD